MADVVVLMHLTREDAWAPVTRLLTGHRVTFVDVPGFGDAPVPRSMPATVAGLAGALHADLAEQGLAGAHVVGLSFAGSMALELARLGGPAGVTAISPPGFWSRREATVVCADVLAIWAGVRLSRRAISLAGHSDVLRGQIWRRLVALPDRMPREVMDSIVLGVPHNLRHLTGDPRLGATLLRSLLGYRIAPLACQAPVTIAWGDLDRFTSYSSQRARARTELPFARHVTLTGCGHIPMYDDPKQVAQMILDSVA